MGFLHQGGQSPAYVPKYTGLQIQTSSNSVPIAIVYGTNRLAPNAIWTGGFYSVAQTQKQGGKGGGQSSVTGYTYYTSFILAVCEGPVHYYQDTIVGQSFYFGLQGAGLAQATFGTTPQTPWGFLSANFPAQALGYNGLAYVGANNYNLGSSPNLPQFSFVMEGIGSIWYGNVVNSYDSDPALIIQDFLTNAQYGVLFPAASLDATTLLGASGDSSYQTYCRASGLALSPVLTNQEAANSIIARWLQLTNTAAVWSGGKLKFIPYGDTAVTGATNIGPVTFNPNVAPIYNLADDDFIHEDGKDPLEVIRSDPYASYNWQRLQINSRDYGVNYAAVPVEAFDQNAIELYGLRRAPDITASEICSPYVGQKSVQLILQRGLYIRNTYNFKLSFEYCLLEPMDLVTVTDAALGLANAAVRITSIEEDDAGLLSVTAEEFPGGIATAVQYPVQGNQQNSTNQAVVPARVNPPVIYEPPAALTGGVAQVWAAVSGGIAPAYLFAETSANGVHSTNQAAISPQASGITVSFSVYAQSAARSAVRLNGFNGSATIGCDFDISAGTAGTPDAGIAVAAIVNAGGGTSAAVTITIASPGAVTWPGNGLVSGQAVYFTTTGALPIGLTPKTIYYALPLTGDTFNVSAAPGGAAINTSGPQSGVQTGVADIWFQISITFAMAALAAPVTTIIIENPYLTQSYAGTAGAGVLVWGAEYSWNNPAAETSQAPTFLPAFSAVTNATLATSGAATPEGVPGVADPSWGGAFVWISTDNATYGQIGTVSAPSRQGVLTASMLATDTSLSATLEESGGQLLSGTASDAQNGITLCLVDKELLAYQTATLLAAPPPNSYHLTGLVRGFYGTAAAAHSNGAPFTRVDSAVFQYNLPATFVGVPLYLKFQSFNIFGQAVEDLSECAVYTYTPSGSGQLPGPVTQALIAGTSLDFGLVTAAVSETDQWGIVTDGFLLAQADLGAGIP